MKQLLLIFVTHFLLSACSSEVSKKNTVEQPEPFPFESAIKYIQKDLKDQDVAAEVDGEKLSWEQLNGSDPALAELDKTHNEQALAFAFAWAQSLQTDSENPLMFYGQKTETERDSILNKYNVQGDENLKVQFENSPKLEILAKLGEKKVTWTDFWKSNISHSKTYRKLFDQRMRRLNGMVVRRYILKASKNKNIQMEEYIQTNILKADSEVTEDDVRSFAKEKGISETDLDETMMKRLEAIISQKGRDAEMEKFVAKELQKEPVAVNFAVPNIGLNLTEIDKSVPNWGGEGKSDLMFIGHWSCRDCPETLQSFLQSKEKWQNNIHGLFVFSFPEHDRLSRMGAEAGLCVESLSKESFWSFLSSMSSQEEKISEEGINSAVKSTSVDFDKFRDCFLKREFQQKVDSHLAYAKKLGITTPPLLVLQGQVLPSSTDMAQLSEKLKDISNDGDKGTNQKGFIARIKAFFGF